MVTSARPRATVLRHAWVVLPAAFALFFIVPLVGLLVRAASDGDVGAQLRAGSTWTALRLSVMTATFALALAIVLGTPLAYALASSRASWARLAATLLDLPLVLPPVVSGIALLTVFGRRGYLGEPLAEAGISLSFTTAAVVIAQLFVAGPYYLRSAYAGFAGTDPRFQGVAYTLGLSRWTTFRRVTLPLVWPSLAGGAVLCWARALGELGATLLFAGSLPGKTQTMPLAIVTAFESSAGLAGAVSIAVILVGFALLLLLLLHRYTNAVGPYR
ncbi:MAG: molybdate ABC transporter permease subunit [Chloroflexi bacterium]|nr:molybdate ABC transporter permease subunit [Chloroflexota bacterium]